MVTWYSVAVAVISLLVYAARSAYERPAGRPGLVDSRRKAWVLATKYPLRPEAI
jgi:hypothetical protein